MRRQLALMDGRSDLQELYRLISAGIGEEASATHAAPDEESH